MLAQDNETATDAGKEAAPLTAWHYAALLVPYAALLAPWLYARWSPTLFGIPFFYAYQFAWVLLSASITALVYRRITRC